MIELEKVNHRAFNLLSDGKYLCQINRDMAKWLKDKLEEALNTEKPPKTD